MPRNLGEHLIEAYIVPRAHGSTDPPMLCLLLLRLLLVLLWLWDYLLRCVGSRAMDTTRGLVC